jgi:SAM-dependent methyltransferase
MEDFKEAFVAGAEFAKAWKARNEPAPPEAGNPLRSYFYGRRSGRGMMKWDHYFDVYDRHLCRFRGKDVHALEIGVQSGGSLEMWKEYFGPSCQVYGVDINPACEAFCSDRVKVFVGDQADRAFWQRFRGRVPALDVVIDDGGHTPVQQRVSFEELLPHLRPGGVYICEDVHDVLNPFATYLNGFSHQLNSIRGGENNPDSTERRIVCRTTPVQAAIASVHLYPFLAVIERSKGEVSEFVSAMRGTEWIPV